MRVYKMNLLGSLVLLILIKEIHHLQYLGCFLCNVQVDQLASNRSAKIGSLALDVDGEVTNQLNDIISNLGAHLRT